MPLIPLTLRDGKTVTADPRLDLCWDKDPRNRLFPVTASLPSTELSTTLWPAGPVTDQGKEGACVGHGWTGWLTGHPLMFTPPVTADEYALEYYRETQRIDEWPGEGYSGTSVKAGGELARTRGLVSEYRWAFGLEQVLQTLSQVGPVVMGLPWYDSFYEPTDAILKVQGTKVGGHCILATGVDVEAQVVMLKNSWGTGWGSKGFATIAWADLDALLKDGGEACVPMPAEVGALSQ